MQKNFFKKIDFVFFNERRIRRIVSETRKDRILPELRNSGSLSDPTAQDAVRNLSLLPQIIICGEILKLPELWLSVIEKTYAWCKRQSELHFQIVRRKYNGEQFHRICRDLAISKSTFFSLIHRARQYAALQAVQFRLIYILTEHLL